MNDSPSSQNPLVTVGIPVFNGEKEIPKVMTAILAQDYPNIEVLFADNCSSDDSLSIILNLIKTNKNVRLITSERNNGALANINRLFENASGEYMLIACLDDAWSHDFISSSVRTLENSKDAPLCIPHVNLCLEPMNEIYYSISLEDNYFSGSRPMRFWKTLRSFPSVGWYGLYRMSAVREVGPIPISIAGDLVFLQKLSLAGEFRHSSNAVLTFSVPKQWNTREQDFAFFYGNSKRPWLKRPFLIVLGTQLSSISKMKISPIHKFVFLTQILLNLLLDKTAILFFQALKFFPIYEDTKKCIVSILYRRFLKPKWLIIVAKDLFFNREIYGRFGYNKSQNTRCVN